VNSFVFFDKSELQNTLLRPSYMPSGPGGNRLGDLGPVAPHGFCVTKGVHELLAGHGTARRCTIRDIAVEQDVGLPLVTLDQRIEALDKKEFCELARPHFPVLIDTPFNGRPHFPPFPLPIKGQ